MTQCARGVPDSASTSPTFFALRFGSRARWSRPARQALPVPGPRRRSRCRTDLRRRGEVRDTVHVAVRAGGAPECRTARPRAASRGRQQPDSTGCPTPVAPHRGAEAEARVSAGRGVRCCSNRDSHECWLRWRPPHLAAALTSLGTNTGESADDRLARILGLVLDGLLPGS